MIGGIKDTMAELLPAEPDSEVGALGVVAGVPVTVDEAVPTPILFTALNLIE